MVRRLNRDYRTKIRNIPRRLKALQHWADSFTDAGRGDFPENEHYWNYKIPVDINLVEGKYSTRATKAACAQALINACSNLLTARPADEARITCVICLPDMFTSEVCIYRSEAYYQGFICEQQTQHGSSSQITDRSLATEWGLLLPANVQELGVKLDLQGFDDPDDRFVGERWYYGNVL